MSFLYPWVLPLLVLTPLWLRQRAYRTIVLSSLAGWKGAAPPRRVRWLKALRVMRALGFGLLVIAMAGPRQERSISEESRQGVAIEMLVDISSSMDLNITGRDGAAESRIDAAKQAVEAFIENRPDDLLGLITFARYADTLSPLTFGHQALIQLVREIEIQDRPNEDGTAYGDALSLACAHLDQMNRWDTELAEDDAVAQVQSKAIILLTDGENNCGLHLPQEAAGLAKQWGIRIYAISLGDTDEAEWTDAEELLSVISEATGGGFWKIFDIEELSETYDQIDALEKSEIVNATLLHTEHTSVFPFFALPAFLILLLERTLHATGLRVAEEGEA